jgi:hypothetical protein
MPLLFSSKFLPFYFLTGCYWNLLNYSAYTRNDFTCIFYRIWSPDILLANSASPSFNNAYQSNVVVYSSGFCEWIPPGIFLSTCQVNSLNIPLILCQEPVVQWAKAPTLEVFYFYGHGFKSWWLFRDLHKKW